MTEDEARAAVVAEAMSWLTTKYHPNAALKGVGADCAQFPRQVYITCGLIPDEDPGQYPSDWHLHRDDERFLGWVLKFATETTRDKVGPGDFGLWRYGRAFSHGAIFTAPPQIIHASRRARMVTLGDMDADEELKVGARPGRFFTLWGR